MTKYKVGLTTYAVFVMAKHLHLIFTKANKH